MCRILELIQTLKECIFGESCCVNLCLRVTQLLKLFVQSLIGSFRTLGTTASVCQQKQEKVSVDHAPKNGLIAL